MPFYNPVKENRWFRAEKKYSDIKWGDFKEVVAEFTGRIEDWYIKPAETLQKASGHYSFAIMALNCLLIDALSQYYFGAQQSPTEAANGCNKPCADNCSRRACTRLSMRWLPEAVRNSRVISHNHDTNLESAYTNSLLA